MQAQYRLLLNFEGYNNGQKCQLTIAFDFDAQFRLVTAVPLEKSLADCLFHIIRRSAGRIAFHPSTDAFKKFKTDLASIQLQKLSSNGEWVATDDITLLDEVRLRTWAEAAKVGFKGAAAGIAAPFAVAGGALGGAGMGAASLGALGASTVAPLTSKGAGAGKAVGEQAGRLTGLGSSYNPVTKEYEYNLGITGGVTRGGLQVAGGALGLGLGATATGLGVGVGAAGGASRCRSRLLTAQAAVGDEYLTGAYPELLRGRRGSAEASKRPSFTPSQLDQPSVTADVPFELFIEGLRFPKTFGADRVFALDIMGLFLNVEMLPGKGLQRFLTARQEKGAHADVPVMLIDSVALHAATNVKDFASYHKACENSPACMNWVPRLPSPPPSSAPTKKAYY